ncbi:MAG: imelysin family protein [Bacteroidota bacterium]
MKNILHLFAAFAVVAFFTACGDDDNSGGGGVEPPPSVNLAQSRQDMAGHLANQFILPAFDALARDVADLKAEVDAMEGQINQANLDRVRSALRSSRITWQAAAIYQMGPAIANALRSSANTYPVDVDKVDGFISSGEYTLGTLASQGAVGFPAIDYLINAHGALDRLSEADGAAYKYLKDVTDFLNDQVSLVADEWKSDSFLTNFASEAANGTDVGSALGMLINSIDLHLQRFLRDGKVAIPAGVRSAGVPRPKLVESFYGGYSVVLLREAVNDYVNLLKGRGANDLEGTSLLAYLRLIEQEALAQNIETVLSDLQSKVDLLNDPLQDQIATDNDKLIDVFLSFQELVGYFKTDIASVTGVTITNQDVDGD